MLIMCMDEYHLYLACTRSFYPLSVFAFRKTTAVTILLAKFNIHLFLWQAIFCIFFKLNSDNKNSLRNPPPPCEDYPPPLSEVYSLLFVAFHLLARLNNHLPDFTQYISFLCSLFPLQFSCNPKKEKNFFPFRSE
jgi:hypothetical protein